MRRAAGTALHPSLERRPPTGYRLVRFGETASVSNGGAWVRIIVQAGERPDEAAAHAQWAKEFEGLEAELRERMLFVLDPEGTPVGTATAWYYRDGDVGQRGGRVHWVSVVPAAQGKGLAKLLLGEVLRKLRSLHSGGPTHLVTHTQAARAIAMYLEVGFEPGPLNPDGSVGHRRLDAKESPEEAAGWAELVALGLPVEFRVVRWQGVHV